MRKVKIVTGVIGKGKGGMSRFAVDLFKRLDPERFDVTFLSNDPHPFFGEEILQNGGHIAYIASRERHPLRHSADLRRIMREGNFDVCHIHLSTASNIAPLIAAKKSGVPLVIGHAHASGLSGGKAAALLYARTGVREVYAGTLSESGLAALRAHGIRAEYSVLTERIVNRTGDGLCPMESATLTETDPARALEKIKAKLQELTQKGG